MEERRKFNYQGKEYEEDELILVNGTEPMYLRTVWVSEGVTYFLAYYARHGGRPITQYREDDNFCNHSIEGFSDKDGDTIEKANAEDYKKPEEPIVYVKYKPREYLIDGWTITIILMILSLALKPVGAWPIMILVTWLILRHAEIERCNKIVETQRNQKR